MGLEAGAEEGCEVKDEDVAGDPDPGPADGQAERVWEKAPVKGTGLGDDVEGRGTGADDGGDSTTGDADRVVEPRFVDPGGKGVDGRAEGLWHGL